MTQDNGKCLPKHWSVFDILILIRALFERQIQMFGKTKPEKKKKITTTFIQTDKYFRRNANHHHRHQSNALKFNANDTFWCEKDRRFVGMTSAYKQTRTHTLAHTHTLTESRSDFYQANVPTRGRFKCKRLPNAIHISPNFFSLSLTLLCCIWVVVALVDCDLGLSWWPGFLYEGCDFPTTVLRLP